MTKRTREDNPKKCKAARRVRPTYIVKVTGKQVAKHTSFFKGKRVVVPVVIHYLKNPAKPFNPHAVGLLS